jgi:hypothetical protein
MQESSFDSAGTVGSHGTSSRGRRLGTPGGLAGLGLSLVLSAGLAACGSSASSASAPSMSTEPTLGPSPSAEVSSGNVEATFEWAGDMGGIGTFGSVMQDAGYTDRYEEGVLDHLGEAYAIIDQGLPKAVDLNEVKTAEPGTVSGDVQIDWWPDGRHDTALPPGGHGDRIYRVTVDLGSYVKGGDAVAYVWFLSQAQAGALDSEGPGATPDPYPSECFSFRLDKETAAALIDVFWVKGEAPAS